MASRNAIIECPHYLILRFLLASGCDSNRTPLPQYSPGSFRCDLRSLIGGKHHDAAVAYLDTVDASRQAAHDQTGYLTVGEDMIVLPGLDDRVHFDRSRDWQMPGTGDAIDNDAWQDAAVRFAVSDNRSRGIE